MGLCKLLNLAICLLILAISQMGFGFVGAAQDRRIMQDYSGSARYSKLVLRNRIGSRPPRCYRRCATCGECEAVQVPTNPRFRGNFPAVPVMMIAYARGGDDTSNYMPMNWKCKCGNLIFNP